MNDGFAAKVRDVLSDTLSLPAGFLDYLIEWQAVNALPSKPLPAVLVTQVNPTYSASITLDARLGNKHTITANNTTAFTINPPANAPDAGHSQELEIEIVNLSGGAMGVITWSAAAGGFHFAGLTWTNPAFGNIRKVLFRWSARRGQWIATHVSSADY